LQIGKFSGIFQNLILKFDKSLIVLSGWMQIVLEQPQLPNSFKCIFVLMTQRRCVYLHENPGCSFRINLASAPASINAVLAVERVIVRSLPTPFALHHDSCTLASRQFLRSATAATKRLPVMAPKQATLGYVKCSQTTLGWEEHMHRTPLE
jgi:hypothetical protein